MNDIQHKLYKLKNCYNCQKFRKDFGIWCKDFPLSTKEPDWDLRTWIVNNCIITGAYERHST